MTEDNPNKPLPTEPTNQGKDANGAAPFNSIDPLWNTEGNVPNTPESDESVKPKSADKVIKFPPITKDQKRAMEYMADAWAAEDRALRVSIAMKALLVDRYCSDAMLAVAEDTDDIDHAVGVVREAVRLAEKNLPVGCLIDDSTVGKFWTIKRTQPYMRALAALARVLYDAEQLDEAISTGLEMMRLSPDDGIGIRYELIAWLIEADRDAEASDFVAHFLASELSALLFYLAALLTYRKEGAGENAMESLSVALGANRHVCDYLLAEELPDLPEEYLPGDHDEALIVVYTLYSAWEKTEGYVDWMLATAKQIEDLEAEEA